MSPLPAPFVRLLPVAVDLAIRDFFAADPAVLSLTVIDDADYVAVARGDDGDLVLVGRYASDDASNAALHAYHASKGG